MGVSAEGAACQQADQSRPRNLALALLLLATFLCVIIQLSCFSREITPWVQATGPTLADGQIVKNTILGYSLYADGRVTHIENPPFYDQVIMFLGGSISKSIYSVRPVYAFIASSLAWVVDLRAALLTTNVLGWLLATSFVYLTALELTQILSGVRAWIAALAAGAVALSTPTLWFHLTDLSAHLLAFTVYFGGAYMLLRSRLWERPLPPAEHLKIGAALGLAVLTYNTSIALVMTYVLAALLGRNRLHVIVIVAISTIAYGAFWPNLMNALSEVPTDYRGTEGRYLSHALSAWQAAFTDGSWIARIAVHLGEFLMSDPVSFGMGFCGLLVFLTRHFRQWRLALVLGALWLAPVALAVVWAPSAGARGYISTHGQVIGFALAGAALWDARMRPWFAAVLMVAIALNALSLRATAAGNPFPMQNFVLGLITPPPEPKHLLSTDAIRILDMTGQRAKGIRGLEGAMASVDALRRPHLKERKLPKLRLEKMTRAMFLRAYIVLPVVVFMFAVILSVQLRQRAQWYTFAAIAATLLGAASVVAAPPALAMLGKRPIGYTRGPLLVEANALLGDKVLLHIQPSPGALAALSERCGPAELSVMSIGIRLRSLGDTAQAVQSSARIELSAGGKLIASGSDKFVGYGMPPAGLEFPCARLVEGLAGGSELVVSIAPLHPGVTVVGWQAVEAGKRTAVVVTARGETPLEFVPYVEFLVSGEHKLRRSLVLY